MADRLNLYTLNDVAKGLKVSPYTIKNWYRWAKSEYRNKLFCFPEPKRDERGRMLFTSDDIIRLKRFKNDLRYGMMSEFNRRYK